LPDGAAQPGECRVDALARESVRWAGQHDLALGIIRRGPYAQAHARQVTLAAVHQVIGEARGSAESHEQYARGQGIQCAGMPDLTLAGQASHQPDDVVRRPPQRLVHVQDPREVGGATAGGGSRPSALRRPPSVVRLLVLGAAQWSPPTNSWYRAMRAARAASGGPARSQPAARRWPPPPKGAVSSTAST